MRCGSVLDIAEDHAQVILMQQASLLLRGFLLSHVALDYATENAAVGQASHFCHLVIFIELSCPVPHLEEFVNNDYYFTKLSHCKWERLGRVGVLKVGRT